MEAEVTPSTTEQEGNPADAGQNGTTLGLSHLSQTGSGDTEPEFQPSNETSPKKPHKAKFKLTGVHDSKIRLSFPPLQMQMALTRTHLCLLQQAIYARALAPGTLLRRLSYSITIALSMDVPFAVLNVKLCFDTSGTHIHILVPRLRAL